MASRLPIAARRFTPSRGSGRDSPAADRTLSLDKALDTPDLIAARAGAALDFRTDINGLRALAVIGVVLFHADRAWVPGGFAGVDIFFVISGFLISRIILAECAAGRFSLTMFYAKRAKRILPALIVMVGFVWIVGWFRAAPTQYRDIGGDMLGNSYFTVNFWLMRLAGAAGYFAADFGREASAALVVARHRRAILPRLVGSHACAVQAWEATRSGRHLKRSHRLFRCQRRHDPKRSYRRVLPAL